MQSLQHGRNRLCKVSWFREKGHAGVNHCLVVQVQDVFDRRGVTCGHVSACLIAFGRGLHALGKGV